MDRILLVEPNYRNKFPPIGLMKIASYHKQRGDIVEFYKGEAPYTQIIKVDRVYITSLFTYHYDITVKTMKHYLQYIHKEAVYIGGIAVTLLADKFAKDTGIENILTGLLTDSSLLGYGDNVNIDRLPLDYDILDDVSYIYPAGDNYFIYATRGCPRNCDFCAVKILEPSFETTNNIISQVNQVNEVYGEKRNLLMMDNNILFSDELDQIIHDIISLGFTEKASYLRPNQFSMMMGKISRRQNNNIDYTRQIAQTISMLINFKKRFERYKKASDEYDLVLNKILNSENKLEVIYENHDYLVAIFDKYSSKSKISRYVDFNQGIDARLINQHNAKLLSKLPIRPFRLAFDSVDDKDVFLEASRLALQNGIKYFSNYLLYNWEDRPEHLWDRLNTANDFYNSDDTIKGFSFPMRYAPIDQTNRKYVGKHWNKKYLRAINVIINVTRGVVAKERDFFEEAFGRNVDEYLGILTMPDEFIRYRMLFKESGIIQLWKKYYHQLCDIDKRLLLDILSKMVDEPDVLESDYSIQITRMLVFYKIKKSQVENGEVTAKILHQHLQKIKKAESNKKVS